jgi:hypothetical protein
MHVYVHFAWTHVNFWKAWVYVCQTYPDRQTERQTDRYTETDRQTVYLVRPHTPNTHAESPWATIGVPGRSHSRITGYYPGTPRMPGLRLARNRIRARTCRRMWPPLCPRICGMRGWLWSGMCSWCMHVCLYVCVYVRNMCVCEKCGVYIHIQSRQVIQASIYIHTHTHTHTHKDAYFWGRLRGQSGEACTTQKHTHTHIRTHKDAYFWGWLHGQSEEACIQSRIIHTHIRMCTDAYFWGWRACAERGSMYDLSESATTATVTWGVYVCMYVCMYACKAEHICMFVSVSMWVCVSMFGKFLSLLILPLWPEEGMYVCMYVCMYVFKEEHMCMYVCVSMCVCVCVYTAIF